MPHSEIQVEIDNSSWNLPDYQLCLESKTEPSVAKGGDTTQKTDILEGGGHRTYLIEIRTLHIHYWGGDTADAIGVGTPHIAYWGGDTAQH